MSMSVMSMSVMSMYYWCANIDNAGEFFPRAKEQRARTGDTIGQGRP
jgi:hypothetical protein